MTATTATPAPTTRSTCRRARSGPRARPSARSVVRRAAGRAPGQLASAGRGRADARSGRPRLLGGDPARRHRRGQPQQRDVPVRQGRAVRERPRGAARGVAVLPGDGSAAAHHACASWCTPRSPRGRSDASRTRSRRTPRASSTSCATRAAAPTSSNTAPRNCRSARCRTWSASPKSERQQVAHAADAHGVVGRPGLPRRPPPAGGVGRGQMYLHQVAGALAADRRENPGDDLISALVHAEVDGDRLTDAEVAAFFVLLSVAGNDTTRQTTSHAMKALTDFPRPARLADGRFRQPHRRRGRGVHPLGHPGDDVPPHGRNRLSSSAVRPSRPGRRS